MRNKVSHTGKYVSHRKTLAFVVKRQKQTTEYLEFLLHKYKENGYPPHIQASRFLSGAAPTHGQTLRSQNACLDLSGSLHFACAPLKDSDLFE